jgi:N-acetylmuramoyl-L-alanine amidase
MQQPILIFTILFACLYFNFDAFAQQKAKSTAKFVKIMLDAGHGGYDPGTERNQENMKHEKDIVLAITKKLGDKILLRLVGSEVLFTRKRDIYLKLETRVALANESKADLFLSIHCNSNPKKTIYGTQMHIHNNTFRKSRKLAQHLDKAFEKIGERKTLGIFNTKDRRFPLYVLQYTKMTGVLVEIGFLSNAKEEEFLNSEAGQDLVAESILHGIVTYCKADNFAVHLLPKSTEVKEELAKTNSEAGKKLIKEIDEATKKYETQRKQDEEAAKTAKVVYRVQISSSKQPIAMTHYDFAKLQAKNYKIEEVITDNDTNGKKYRYFVGKEGTLEASQAILAEIKKFNFKDAFITSFEQ